MQKNAEEITKKFFGEILENKREDCGKLREKWEKEEKTQVGKTMQKVPVLVWIRPYQQETHLFQKTEAAEQKEIMEYASSLLKQFMDRISPVYCMMNWERRGILAVFPQKELPDSFSALGNKILTIFQNYFGNPAFVAVSTPAENIWEGFGRGVHQIRTLEEYYYYHSAKLHLCAGFSS